MVDADERHYLRQRVAYEVKAFVTEYLDQNPHLQRAARFTGAGSTSAIGLLKYGGG